MSNLSTIWPKVITVDKNIIKILSESTYENFPSALKELITNSYDAKATKVKVTVNLESEEIVISDDGHGMNEADYEFYLRIAGKHREVKEYEESSRKKIGQFGVGFLSVFPFFRNYRIESKKAGAEESIDASIPCHLYFDDNNRLVNISDIKIDGGTRKGIHKVKEHFTRITLSGFTPITKEFFFPNKQIKQSRNSIKNSEYFSTIEKLKWTLSEDLPIPFQSKKFEDIFDYNTSKIPFEVEFNDKPLRRIVYAENEILETHDNPYSQIGRIKFQYFISTNRKPIHPNEGRYLKIRNVNVGVGDRVSFIGSSVQGGYPRLQQLTGEVHIIEGLNDLIKVSRDGFNYSPDYEELKSFLARRLIHFSSKLQEEKNQEKDKDPKKIRSVKSIKPVNKKKTEKSETQKKRNDGGGESEKKVVSNSNVETVQPTVVQTETTVDEPETTFEFEGRDFIVKSDKWDYVDADFPACKIVDDNVLIVNSKYPLFKGVKHTDVFIKIHLLLLNNLHKDIISQKSYNKMAHQVLNIYKEYWK